MVGWTSQVEREYGPKQLRYYLREGGGVDLRLDWPYRPGWLIIIMTASCSCGGRHCSGTLASSQQQEPVISIDTDLSY